MNLKLLDFSIASLKRRFWKNLSIFFIFFILIFTLFSVLLVAKSIEKELAVTYESLPDIYVQKMIGGRVETMNEERIYKIADISGVESVSPRVWGYYYFQSAGVNFSLVGLDFSMESFKKSYSDVIEKFYDTNETNFMIIGQGVKKTLQKSYYHDSFNFVKPNGEFLKVKFLGVFKSQSELESSDTILLPIGVAREIFGMDEDEINDIVVKVSNPLEVGVVKTKIKYLYPDCRVLSRDDIRVSYQNIFDYKSGLFLALFLSSFVAFFILVYERAGMISKEQIKEIAIMRAVGWQVWDILKLKFLEASLLSVGAYFLALVGAYGFVYILKAPYIRDLFMGYSVLKPEFDLIPVFDVGLMVSIFLVSVPVYLAATIIPTWRGASVEVEEALR